MGSILTRHPLAALPLWAVFIVLVVCALLALALASVVLLIEDLDRPQQGALRVSQQAMEDVQRLIQADAP